MYDKKELTKLMIVHIVRNNAFPVITIIKELSRVITINEAGLFSLLNGLVNDGLIQFYVMDDMGKNKKYYIATEAGKGKITEYLEGMNNSKKVYEFIRGEKYGE